MKVVPLVVAAALLAALPAQAADPNSGQTWDKSQDMLEEGARRVMGALELLLQAIPQYAMPEILPNGDILIRRKHPERDAPAAPDRDKT